jgi:uncharacterized protein YdeI (YjbR/CyaY-like superfamily)
MAGQTVRPRNHQRAGTMIETERFEQVEVASAADLRGWLAANHAQEASVWLVTFKKHVAGTYLSRDTVLDELIAFGWIDGIRRVLDDDRTMQLISPRRHQRWARSYTERAARLEAEGRIAPPGLAAIEQARALGLWNALPEVDALTIPDDLASAFTATPPAAANFAAAAPSYRRNVLRWIASAVKPETRSARIAKTAQYAARGEKLPQM